MGALKVLVFLDHFSPAYKAGGPIRVYEALAEARDPGVEVSIATQDRDWGDPRPLPVRTDRWTPFAGARVIYLGRAQRGLGRVRALSSEADLVHLNSLFSRVWTFKALLLRRLGLIRARVLLSPHGELADSALRIKPGRKRLFLAAARLLGLFRGLTWVATTPKEAGEIRARIGPGVRVETAPPPLPAPVRRPAGRAKAAGRLDLVVLARVSAMKNIPFLLGLLPRLRGEVRLDVFGPIDPQYEAVWRRELERARAARGARVEYAGIVPAARAREVLSRYDLFVQPSLSENFGYSIVEAVAAGTPVLISDRTPWNEVTDAGIGAALPLERPDLWVAKLQEFVDMDDAGWRACSDRTREWLRGRGTAAGGLTRVYRSLGGGEAAR